MTVTTTLTTMRTSSPRLTCFSENSNGIKFSKPTINNRLTVDVERLRSSRYATQSKAVGTSTPENQTRHSAARAKRRASTSASSMRTARTRTVSMRSTHHALMPLSCAQN